MRLLTFAALVSFGIQAVVGLTTTTTTVATEEPPLCGLKCIQQETLKSTCEVTNATCICTNVELNQKISLCVHANCTLRESLRKPPIVQSYSKHTCGAPSTDRTALVWVIGVVFLAIGLLGFGLRVMARLCLGTQTWGPDDWVMLLAVCMMIPLNALSIPISQVALGKDIWNVSPDDITQFLYLFYWDELLYLGALPVTKISILLFYLKMFPRKEIRIACWVLIGFNIAYFITFELISIFQCSPIDGAWKAWDKEYPAKCNNINVQGWAAAAFNIVLDIATLILPLGELYKLSMSMKKKIQIMLMFSVGFFVTLVSIVRLRSLASYATTSNVTQDYVEVGYWSTIEVPVGILCACMPAIRSLFSLVFPKVFGTTQGKSNYANISSQQQMSGSQKLSSKASSFLAIRVKKEFTIKSKHKDDVSIVELNSIPYSGDPVSRPPSERKATTPHESV
ncbi:CFEM domain-containing protein [Colletotrichum truncatum]|uniref:CFEM domain-containing protein n=1 Tax=Colletotrichum truncatum TaxID=5467 RepID=A0ACC3YVW5_COLTU|nr:CFEM domain-containing protein [Colletotrichum truncatum]KAF6791193.1 CFEM domain-containing protein [Colletotrichum truncatum]